MPPCASLQEMYFTSLLHFFCSHVGSICKGSKKVESFCKYVFISCWVTKRVTLRYHQGTVHIPPPHQLQASFLSLGLSENEGAKKIHKNPIPSCFYLLFPIHRHTFRNILAVVGYFKAWVLPQEPRLRSQPAVIHMEYRARKKCLLTVTKKKKKHYIYTYIYIYT